MQVCRERSGDGFRPPRPWWWWLSPPRSCISLHISFSCWHWQRPHCRFVPSRKKRCRVHWGRRYRAYRRTPPPNFGLHLRFQRPRHSCHRKCSGWGMASPPGTTATAIIVVAIAGMATAVFAIVSNPRSACCSTEHRRFSVLLAVQSQIFRMKNKISPSSAIRRFIRPLHGGVCVVLRMGTGVVGWRCYYRRCPLPRRRQRTALPTAVTAERVGVIPPARLLPHNRKFPPQIFEQFLNVCTCGGDSRRMDVERHRYDGGESVRA